ncbi:MAG: extracellular solute-binding protein [Synergistaceae bacterium]|jgi:multiple sugar transport system substrate-binding protein|nr:extracellular solute-binding protein [Synergistaceae bacterium]
MKNPNAGKRRKKRLWMCGALCAVAAVLSLWLWLREKPSDPVVLTMWHNPGSQARHALSEVAEEFNRTLGREKGITLLVTSIGTSRVLHEKLELIANRDPGAPEPPDIAIAYPKTAILLARKNRLADLAPHFTGKELAAYVPRFLEEGRILNGGLYVFPVNKSTEGLIVNRTLFDPFAEATGARIEDLATTEGLLRLAREYHRWTDDRTPTPGDGQMFFMFDSLFNFAQTAFQQLGEDFFAPSKDGKVIGKINVDSPIFRKVWDAAYEPAVRGWAAIYEGYGTDLTKTGDLVCWTSSTAGITFLPTSMIYSDNTSVPVTFDLLPCPVFEGGRKTAIQRAGGFCLLKSTPEREKAAVIFLKWLTAPENNLNYLRDTGYLPVTAEAIRRAVVERSATAGAGNAVPLRDRFLDLMAVMEREYDFFIPPLLDDYERLERKYESLLRKSAQQSREKFLELRESMGPDEAFRAASEGAFANFTKALTGN